MLEAIPFLLDAKAFGVIALMIMMASTMILMVPVFASRGSNQIWWLLGVGFLLTVEAGVLITIGILIDQGEILQ